MNLRKSNYLCFVDGQRQQISHKTICKSVSSFNLSGSPREVFFIYGSSHVLSMLGQIVGQKSNILNSNIHKPTSASNDLTASTGDKGVFNRRLYTLRDK